MHIYYVFLSINSSTVLAVYSTYNIYKQTIFIAISPSSTFSNLNELQPTWLLRTPKAREIQGQVQHQGSIVEDSVTAMHLVIGIFICMDPVEPLS